MEISFLGRSRRSFVLLLATTAVVGLSVVSPWRWGVNESTEIRVRVVNPRVVITTTSIER